MTDIEHIENQLRHVIGDQGGYFAITGAGGETLGVLDGNNLAELKRHGLGEDAAYSELAEYVGRVIEGRE